MALSSSFLAPLIEHNFSHWKILGVSLAFLPICLIVAFYIYATPTAWKDSRRKHLPPGPSGLPLIGNYFDLYDAKKFRYKAVDWAKQYGDVFYTKMGGSDYVWLSSPQAVKDLMDKKSNIYSSRPETPLANMASDGNRQLFLPYGQRYRTLRKMSHIFLNINASIKYEPIQDLESKQLLSDLVRDPDNFYSHNQRYAASVVVSITYGERFETWDAPVIKAIHSVLDHLQEFSEPGHYLIDMFPEFKILPQWMVGNWKKAGKKYFEHDHKVYLGLWEDLKRKVDQGTANPCFAKDFYQSNMEKLGVDDMQAAFQNGFVVEAGSETTSSYLNIFVRAMAMHPHVMKKAQEELDRVVGESRLPTFDDWKELVYIRALIKEIFRVFPPNKFGMQHALTEDDWYKGMFIPKGSVVMLNWWALHYDPERWKSPDVLEPERYLGYDEPAAAYFSTNDPDSRDQYIFGAGRRVCAGVHIAERSIYLNIARTLWAFDINKKVIDGNVIDPDTGYVRGWMSIPAKFEVDIRPRSAKKVDLINKAWSEAKADLERDGGFLKL